MPDDVDARIQAAMAALLKPRMGHLPQPWPKTLRDELRELSTEWQLDPLTLLARLSTMRAHTRESSGSREAQAIARLVASATVPHTTWFRHRAQLDRLRTMLTGKAERRPHRVWSAGCATGEEPYTLAMIAREAGVPISILATDVNAQALATAASGSYSAEGLRRAGVRVEGQVWEAPPNLREAIRFERASLTDPDPTGGDRGRFDIIFCRNVLIYFEPSAATDVLGRLVSYLRPGGSIVVAPVDALRALPPRLHRVEPLGWLEQRAVSEPPRVSEPPAPPARPDRISYAALSLGLGALDEAERALGGVLARDPELAEAWFLLGETLERRGEKIQAATAFRKAMQHATEDEEGRTLANAAERRARAISG